jgi:hypothetical protein
MQDQATGSTQTAGANKHNQGQQDGRIAGQQRQKQPGQQKQGQQRQQDSRTAETGQQGWQTNSMKINQHTAQ